MVARISASAGAAAIITFGLLLLMQLLIATGEVSLAEPRDRFIVDFVRIVRPPPPEPPPDTERSPPDLVRPPVIPDFGTHDGVRIVLPSDPLPPGPPGSDRIAVLADGEALPIVAVAPTYPPAAIRRGLEGYVIVEYTVTRTGAVDEVAVVEASHPVFEQAAIDAAYRFKYRPRVVNGEPVARPGVRRKVTFVLEN